MIFNLFNNILKEVDKDDDIIEQYKYFEVEDIVKKFQSLNIKKEKDLEKKIGEFIPTQIDKVVSKSELFEKILDNDDEINAFFNGMIRVLLQLYPNKFEDTFEIKELIFEIIKNRIFIYLKKPEGYILECYVKYNQNIEVRHTFDKPYLKNNLLSISNSVFNNYIEFEASEGDIDLIENYCEFLKYRVEATNEIVSQFEGRNVLDVYYFGLYHGYAGKIWRKYKDELEYFTDEDSYIHITFKYVSANFYNEFLEFWDAYKYDEDYVEGYRKGQKL